MKVLFQEVIMKKRFLTILFALVAAASLPTDTEAAEIMTSNDIPQDIKPVVLEKINAKDSFFYVRMGVADAQAHQVPQFTQGFFIPGIGLGYRLGSDNSSIDLSANYTYGYADLKESRSYFYTLPKVNYLRYVSPKSKQSFYYGAGLAWGGIRNQEKSEFIGIIPNLSLGYEMNRKSNWVGFTQLDVSQPALAAYKKNGLPGPLAELSVGFGY